MVNSLGPTTFISAVHVMKAPVSKKTKEFLPFFSFPSINSQTRFSGIKTALHQKARFEKPNEYPGRVSVPDAYVSWNTPFPEYRPQYYVSPIVRKNDSTLVKGGWADPEQPLLKSFISFGGPITCDVRGLPLNPKGRTGLEGRGLLGKWGANFAADPIVTRVNPVTKQLELLVILRKDCNQWALPGGMVDAGEVITKTLARELEEETSIHLEFDQAHMVYQGYVDDMRNTDNAWMETTASHIHLDMKDFHLHAKPQAGDDARKAKWVPISASLRLFASHNDFVRRALIEFKNRETLNSVVEKQIYHFLQPTRPVFERMQEAIKYHFYRS